MQSSSHHYSFAHYINLQNIPNITLLSPSPFLTPITTHITLSYVQLPDLGAFFITHKLNRYIIFKYNLYSHTFSTPQLNTLLSIFPNMIPTGLILIPDTTSHHLPKAWLHKLTHLCITDTNYTTITYSSPKINLHILKKCPNLLSLSIYHVNISHPSNLLHCPQLRSIGYNRINHDHKYFPQLPNLRIVKLNQCTLTPTAISNLSKINRLTTLLIKTTNLYSTFNFPKLIHLTIQDGNTPPFAQLTLSMLDQCPSLKILEINARITVTITPTNYNLHTLSIIESKVKNINTLNVSTLKILKLIFCECTERINPIKHARIITTGTTFKI